MAALLDVLWPIMGFLYVVPGYFYCIGSMA